MNRKIKAVHVHGTTRADAYALLETSVNAYLKDHPDGRLVTLDVHVQEDKGYLYAVAVLEHEAHDEARRDLGLASQDLSAHMTKLAVNATKAKAEGVTENVAGMDWAEAKAVLKEILKVAIPWARAYQRVFEW